MQRFLDLDRLAACAREADPDGFGPVGPDRRLIGFDIDGNSGQQVSVIGQRGTAVDFDIISWQTGRAHVLRYEASTQPRSADPHCRVSIERRAGIARAIERLDPTTLAATTVRNALGMATIYEFFTLGRTRSCLYVSQEATRPAPDQGSLSVVTMIRGMDCRDLHPNVRAQQRRDLLPVVASIRVGN